MTEPSDAEEPDQPAAGGVADAVGPDKRLSAIGPRFKSILFSILGLVVLALAIEVVLSVYGPQHSHNVRHVLATCDWIIKAGMGFIPGMYAGKATR